MKRVIFIGQAMPRFKKHPHDWPSLNQWLYSIGFTDELIRKNTLYSALVDYFPGAVDGSHIVPSKSEIAEERNKLKTTINGFNPEIIVPVGRLSIAHCLNQKVRPLVTNIGNVYKTNPYGLYTKKLLVIPLPHPSGASTWKHKKEHRVLLDKALNVLKKEICR